MKEPSITTDQKDLEQLDLFQKKNEDKLLNKYEDLELELIKSTRHKFLTWNDF
jgi:hypothetical protein